MKSIPLAPLFPVLHQVLSPMFPGCLWCGNSQRKEVALSFDDGPHPQHTPALLEVLAQFQVPATFFCLGYLAERSPHVVRAIHQAGHQLALHGYYHQSFPLLSATQLQQDLERTQQAIAQACDLDYTQIRDVRPPNGIFTPKILQLLRQWHYRPVMWSVVPEDWAHPGVEVVTQRVMSQVSNGSIIVLHDGYDGGDDVAACTAQILPRLIDQGYQLVRVDQLS
jgi:peptidoglycan/xylan/chitin deacetylase (PgdA/CDA1 family)